MNTITPRRKHVVKLVELLSDGLVTKLQGFHPLPNPHARRFLIQLIWNTGRGNGGIFNEPCHWTERSTIENQSVHDLCADKSEAIRHGRYAGYILKPTETIWETSWPWSKLMSAIHNPVKSL